jgi:hypothetical protein
MIKVLKLSPSQKARVMEILDNGGTEEELNAYLVTLIPRDSLRAEATKIISRSRQIQKSQLLAAASSTTLH